MAALRIFLVPFERATDTVPIQKSAIQRVRLSFTPPVLSESDRDPGLSSHCPPPVDREGSGRAGVTLLFLGTQTKIESPPKIRAVVHVSTHTAAGAARLTRPAPVSLGL